VLRVDALGDEKLLGARLIGGDGDQVEDYAAADPLQIADELD